MFAQFDEIPSLLFQDIKERQNCCGWTERAITPRELPWTLAHIFSIINVHLVDINVFARFDEIPSLPLEDIKERPKHRGWKGARTM